MLYDLRIDDFGGSNSFFGICVTFKVKSKCKDEEGDTHKKAKDRLPKNGLGPGWGTKDRH